MPLLSIRLLAPRPVISIAVLLAAAASVRAEKDAIDETVAQFFRPYELDLATLAPDGRHVAMAQRVTGGKVFIAVVDVDARSSRQYFVAGGSEHALQQLLWIAPDRLVFTTRSRAVGILDLGHGEIRPLLRGGDFDAYQPQPQLGPRSRNVIVTPDMQASATEPMPGPFELRTEISVQEALALAHVSGDLFGSDSTRDTGRSLRPYLLGPKPGSPDVVLLEVRSDTEILRRGDRTTVTVPGNVYVFDRAYSTPGSPAELGYDPVTPGEYASYNIDLDPPPLVVLELDTKKGRVRETAREVDWRRVWLDHKGEVRVALEQRGGDYRYMYRAADAKKWVPLDTIAKTGTPLGFTARSENLLGSRSVPLGFDVGGRCLFIATNVATDTFALRTLDLVTGQWQGFEVTHNRYDLIEPTALTAGDVLRFDRHTRSLAGVRFAAGRRETRWFDSGMNALQDALAKKLAPARCELREWNSDRTRLLVEVSAPNDPGRFFVADPGAGKLISCGDRAPWLTEERRNPTHEFDFLDEEGRRFSGFLTLPRQPRLKPPPVLVYFHDGPWFSDPPVFNRGAQALAALGFAVLQLNHRGSSGLGRKHLTAIDGGLDRVVLDDIKTLLTRIGASKQTINTRMVAALGNGVGGYLAVRMAQLAPETFRCAVAINAPGDLDAWCSRLDVTPTLLAQIRQHFFGSDRNALRAQSALAAARTTKSPVLVVHGSGNSYVPIAMGRELYRALKNSSEDTAFLELPGAGHGGWSEKTTARLFAELGRFFNATIYKYDVKVRTPQVVPDKE